MWQLIGKGYFLKELSIGSLRLYVLQGGGPQTWQYYTSHYCYHFRLVDREAQENFDRRGKGQSVVGGYARTDEVDLLSPKLRQWNSIQHPTWPWALIDGYSKPRITHWGRVTHICVGKLTITGSDNGLSPWRRQAVIWTNAEILLIELLGTKLSEILFKIDAFSL